MGLRVRGRARARVRVRVRARVRVRIRPCLRAADGAQTSAPRRGPRMPGACQRRSVQRAQHSAHAGYREGAHLVRVGVTVSRVRFRVRVRVGVKG